MTDPLILRWQEVKARISTAEQAAGRPAGSVQLLAVSKTHPAEQLTQLYQAGQRAFGENYVQEMTTKAQQLALLEVDWHFIGPLQSNKAREVARTASWVHSLDRSKVAQLLHQHRPDELPPLQVCLQVNLDDETSKSGVKTWDELLALAQDVMALDRLQLRGLMSIPAPSPDPAQQRQAFARLRQLHEQLRAALEHPLDTLSMGMSADLEAAVAEGATIVRIGTDIFGARPPHTGSIPVIAEKQPT